MDREGLKAAVLAALRGLGGKALIVEVAKEIWATNEGLLRKSGDLFYTWQYDMRWAAQRLQDDGLLIKEKSGNHSIWRLL